MANKKIKNTMSKKIEKDKAKQFAAFITDVALAMEKHGVTDMLCVFEINGETRNTYIPLSEEGEMELYCKLSDGINEWLQLIGFSKSGNSKHTTPLSIQQPLNNKQP